MTQEDEWMKRLGQGDADVIEELAGYYYPEILRYCLWHAPNRFLAEDAAQETFLKAIRYFDRYTHSGRFRPFLYKIAANTCVDMRRRSCLTDVSLEGRPEEFAYLEKGFEEAQSDMELLRLVQTLPEGQREIVILRFAQDLTVRQIAEVVGLPLRTVQSRLRSALKQLKKDLERGGMK